MLQGRRSSPPPASSTGLAGKLIDKSLSVHLLELLCELLFHLPNVVLVPLTVPGRLSVLVLRDAIPRRGLAEKFGVGCRPAGLY